jgi:peptidoglycan/xylan/chitin deacetylase (PgdA/CDA1 family)
LKSKLQHILNKFFEPKALALMYHRVTEPESNIWDIRVRPSHFEQHLQVLQETGNVVPLKELVEGVRTKKVRKNSIAITFDDGYADNYSIACPLLEKYAMPATFFIASANVDTSTAFWWDELEQIILYSEHLPPRLSVTINNQKIEFLLNEEARLTERQRILNQSWKACDETPPSMRCEIFYQIWEQLKLVSYETQQQHLKEIRQWSNTEKALLPHYKSMSSAQLLDLTTKTLFDLGAHTVTHPSLAHQTPQQQKQEMMENKKHLEAITGRETALISYPYGNYNTDTIAAATASEFIAAFTTEEKVITNHSSVYKLARFQVKDWDGSEFRKHLMKWLS